MMRVVRRCTKLQEQIAVLEHEIFELRGGRVRLWKRVESDAVLKMDSRLTKEYRAKIRPKGTYTIRLPRFEMFRTIPRAF